MDTGISIAQCQNGLDNKVANRASGVTAALVTRWDGLGESRAAPRQLRVLRAAETEELTNARCRCESEHTPAVLVIPNPLKIGKRTERNHSWGR